MIDSLNVFRKKIKGLREYVNKGVKLWLINTGGMTRHGRGY